MLTAVAILALSLFVAGCSDSNPTSLQTKDTTFTSNDNSEQSMSRTPVPYTCKVNCQGTKCTLLNETVIPGFVDRKYSYILTPGAQGVSHFRVGVHNIGLFNPQNVVMPAGWTCRLVNGRSADRGQLIRHGNTTTHTGYCNTYMEFYGPAMTQRFQIAFDDNRPAHTVSWMTSDFSRSKWFRPVGLGEGPIHSPTSIVGGGGGTYIGPGDTVPIH